MNRTFKITWIASVLSASCVSTAWGGQPEHPQPQPAHPPTQGRPIDQWDHATDDPFQLRSGLEAKGVRPEASLTADYSKNLRGGLNTEGDALRHLFNFNLAVETEPMLKWKGGTFFLNFQNQNGDRAAHDVGSVQGVSNIEADGRTQVSEVWFEQEFLHGDPRSNSLRLKVGKIDANTEFALPRYGVHFLNSSFEYSPTIVAMPTYPDPAFGLIAGLMQDPFFDVQAGIFDGSVVEGVPTGSRGPKTLFGSPSDLFLIAEVGLRSNIPTRWAAGVWHHTGTFDRFDGARESGVTGFYVVGDYRVWQENEAKKDEQGVALFYQYGYVDGDVSAIEQHVGGGITWTGAIRRRDEDVIGLGATYVEFSEESGLDEDGELAVELLYKLQVTRFFAVTGDLQYIVNPGGEGADDALVGTVRVHIDF